MPSPACRGRWLLLTLTLTLTLTLNRAAILPAATWPDEYQSGPFLFHADFPLAKERALLDSLPHLQAQLVYLLGIQPSQEPIYVFLFARRRTYEAYLKEHFPTAPARKALFIKGRGPGMVFVYRGDNFAVDLRHEATHAILNSALPVVPLWLDEGLAEYFEIPAERRRHGSPHLRPIRLAAWLGNVPALEDLEQRSQISEMGRSEYRNAWAWVHFLLHGPPTARAELRRYLAEIQALTPPGKLSQRLRYLLPELEREFAAHFRNW